MIIIDKKQLQFRDGVYDTVSHIPKGVWLLLTNPKTGEFYLSKAQDFTIPSKIYGDAHALSDRYVKTFQDEKKTNNLGIVLSGVKGTGKSLTAKLTALKSKLPIILITEPYGGSIFHEFVNQLKKPVCFFIDEFEKIYSDKEQESILSILDGVTSVKHMFILTSNESQKYNKYLINRPGRIHYLKQHERISDDVLEEISNLLVNPDWKNEFIELMNTVEEANIDMALALVYECNSFNENPATAAQYLNIKIGELTFDVYIKFPTGVITHKTNYKISISDFKAGLTINEYYPYYFIVNKVRVPASEFHTAAYKKANPHLFKYEDIEDIEYDTYEVETQVFDEITSKKVVARGECDMTGLPVEVTFIKKKKNTETQFVF